MREVAEEVRRMEVVPHMALVLLGRPRTTVAATAVVQHIRR